MSRRPSTLLSRPVVRRCVVALCLAAMALAGSGPRARAEAPPEEPTPTTTPTAPPADAPRLSPREAGAPELADPQPDGEGGDTDEPHAPSPGPTPGTDTAEQPAELVAPPVPALTNDDRATLARLAAELPLHGREALPAPPADAPEAAWIALADALTLVFAPRGMPRAERESIFLRARPLGPAVLALVPTHRRYRLLQAALRRVTAFPLEAPTLPTTSYRLRAGTTAPEIEILRARLLREGYGDPGVEGRLARYFDDRLKRALQRWQKSQGLPPTTVIDPLTRRRLNEERPHPAARIALALARWRELSLRHDGEPTIIVHVNTFHLSAEQGGEVALTMPVVVGRDTEKDRTPATSAALEAVIVNPRWVVPPRISEETLRPSAGQDPDKLIARGFDVDVLADGRWRVRMGPGPDNPLGRVKFTLVGTGGVYLHDTPQRQAFRQRERSLSHGCVRVADAVGLARWLVRDVDALDAALSLPSKSQPLRPAHPVTVHLVYQTTSVDENLELVGHPDVYALDGAAYAEVDAAAVIRRLLALPPASDGSPAVAPPPPPPSPAAPPAPAGRTTSRR